MPFKSKAQQEWMYANYPSMAERWQKVTPKNKKLPEHVKKAAASDNAGFDVHQTDPARLAKEVKKDFGLEGKKFRWECNECGNEVISSTRPKRCDKCGDYKFIKLD